MIFYHGYCQNSTSPLLYDEAVMPPELRKGHQQNDFAVMVSYEFDRIITESEFAAVLMRTYRTLTS